MPAEEDLLIHASEAAEALSMTPGQVYMLARTRFPELGVEDFPHKRGRIQMYRKAGVEAVRRLLVEAGMVNAEGRCDDDGG